MTPHPPTAETTASQPTTRSTISSTVFTMPSFIQRQRMRYPFLSLRIVSFTVVWTAVTLGLTISDIAIAEQPISGEINIQPPDPTPVGDDDADEEEDEVKGGMGRIVMSIDEFEQWIYGNLGGSKLAFEQMYRGKVKTALNQVDQICVLRPEQWDKLNAAIDIEVQRFEAKIANLTSEFASYKTADKQQACFAKASEITQAVNADISMLWTKKDQFWKKVLVGQLNEDQRKRFSEDQALRQTVKSNSGLTQIVLRLQRKLGLTEQQREKILEILSSEKEPRTYEMAWLKLIELPNDTKVVLFSEKQREVLNVHVKNDGDDD